MNNNTLTIIITPRSSRRSRSTRSALARRRTRKRPGTCSANRRQTRRATITMETHTGAIRWRPPRPSRGQCRRPAPRLRCRAWTIPRQSSDVRGLRVATRASSRRTRSTHTPEPSRRKYTQLVASTTRSPHRGRRPATSMIATMQLVRRQRAAARAREVSRRRPQRCRRA